MWARVTEPQIGTLPSISQGDASQEVSRQGQGEPSVGIRARAILGVLCAFVVFGGQPYFAGGASAQSQYGPFGPEGPRMREQFWVLPSGSSDILQRATVFRPRDGAPVPAGLSAGSGTRPLVVINHGTSELTREAVAMPVYYWLSRWFVERGYVVVLPQRRGHGATGGDLVEGRDSCSKPDHLAAGLTAAEDINAAVRYMAQQSFIAPASTVLVGISTGGWASLAAASADASEVRAVVNFAGGRGGHAWGRKTEICDAEALITAAYHFGAATKVPTLWLYARNDSYFGPELAHAMSAAWSGGGGSAELHLLPPYGHEGHELADSQAGWRLWGRQLSEFLDRGFSSPQRPPPSLLSAATTSVGGTSSDGSR